MTKPWLTASSLLLLVLAGCTEPVIVRSEGTFFVYPASQNPLRTARCIVRNADRHTPAWIASERPAEDAQAWEVLVRDDSGVLATVRADVAAIRVSIRPWNRAENEKLANSIVGYC